MLGIAISIRISMIEITISSSMSVKPRSFRRSSMPAMLCFMAIQGPAIMLLQRASRTHATGAVTIQTHPTPISLPAAFPDRFTI